MSLIRGKDFMISFKRPSTGVLVPVCYATDVQINHTLKTREITGPQGRAEDFIADSTGYTLQIPALVVYAEDTYSYLDFLDAITNGSRLTWDASIFPESGLRHGGECLPTGLNLTSQFRDLMKYDVNLLGCGVFNTVKLPFNKVVYLADFDEIQLPGCPNPYPVAVFWYDGSLIGPAANAGEVITIFNTYAATHGNQYKILSSVDGGCRFNLQIAYGSPTPYPDVIYAQQGLDFAISSDQPNDNVISPNQLSDDALTPIGTA